MLEPTPDTIPELTGLPSTAPAMSGAGGYLGPATILESNERDRIVLVQWQRAGKPCLSWARPALVNSPPLRKGQTALVLSQNLEEFYLIGLLAETGASQPPTRSSLQTRSGAKVEVQHSEGTEVVQVHSKQGALVLEYHPDSGRTVINVEDGDLNFVAQNGAIAFHSAQKISLTARRLETVAETVVEKATNVYQTVEELSQLQAGRQRTVIEGSCHLKARDAFLVAEHDFKVDGEQIHLG